MTDKKCIYCQEPYEKDTEHVFPHGLGGENIFIDCVCYDCNSKFSGLEGELYQKSPVSLMRSIESIKGYKKKNGNNSYFKAPILLTYDEQNKIVYEISQHDKMEIHLKSQIIDIKGKFYLEGNDEKNILLFLKNIKQWKSKNLIAITKLPNSQENTFEYVKFHKKDQDVEYQLYNSVEVSKDCLLIEDFSENHELFSVLNPRIFFDDNQKIRVRAKTIGEGISFLNNLLKFTLEPKIFKSFNKILNDNGIVYVGLNFHGTKLERAVVKITLNCLFHYFPESRKINAIKNYILFVNNGNTKIKLNIEAIDSLFDTNKNTHNIFFHQFNDSLKLRFSLFNGEIIFSYIIPGIKILGNNDYCRIVIDYKNRINRFENRNDFLRQSIEK